MPNCIKKIGFQSDLSKGIEMYDLNSDISKFITVGKSSSSVALDANYKYNVVTWGDMDSSSLTVSIPSAIQKNQEIYVIFINPLDKDITITVNPVSTNATYYTGEVEVGSNAKGTITLQKKSTMEVSIIRLDNQVNASTVASYYFVRVA